MRDLDEVTPMDEILAVLKQVEARDLTDSEKRAVAKCHTAVGDALVDYYGGD